MVPLPPGKGINLKDDAKRTVLPPCFASRLTAGGLTEYQHTPAL
jgi:hypothetical protein